MALHPCPGELGDIIGFKRKGYWHFGIKVTMYTVVHVTGDSPRGSANVARRVLSYTSTWTSGQSSFYGIEAVVREDYYSDVMGSGPPGEVITLDLPTFNSVEIVQRARQRIGDFQYKMFSSNCEHFVNWCRYGQAESTQALRTKKAIGVTVGVASTGLAIAGTVLVALLKLKG